MLSSNMGKSFSSFIQIYAAEHKKPERMRPGLLPDDCVIRIVPTLSNQAGVQECLSKLVQCVLHNERLVAREMYLATVDLVAA